jgi:glycosyltransferase involved in cell wall biosynthesis
MRIVIATDAWAPQVNGVVNTLRNTRDALRAMGHEVLMITPEGCRTIPCPTYPEIRLALFQGRRVGKILDEFDPHFVHIATEGTIGLTVHRLCRKRGLPFTTAYHTQFPEYVRARFPIPVSLTARLLRWFHGKAARTMVPTKAIKDLLESRGFENIVIWSRGVNTELFKPHNPHDYGLDGPIWVYVGRVAVEKNIELLLGLDLPGTKVIIGDGPDMERLRREYPDCRFVGYKFGEELASYIAGGDAFVFPSKTDTFGLVMLEAMACGLPVAALPVTGPIDVVRHGETGILDDDLQKACHAALELDRDACRRYAETRSWARSTEQFASHLAPMETRDTKKSPATVSVAGPGR